MRVHIPFDSCLGGHRIHICHAQTRFQIWVCGDFLDCHAHAHAASLKRAQRLDATQIETVRADGHRARRLLHPEKVPNPEIAEVVGDRIVDTPRRNFEHLVHRHGNAAVLGERVVCHAAAHILAHDSSGTQRAQRKQIKSIGSQHVVDRRVQRHGVRVQASSHCYVGHHVPGAPDAACGAYLGPGCGSHRERQDAVQNSFGCCARAPDAPRERDVRGHGVPASDVVHRHNVHRAVVQSSRRRRARASAASRKLHRGRNGVPAAAVRDHDRSNCGKNVCGDRRGGVRDWPVPLGDQAVLPKVNHRVGDVGKAAGHGHERIEAEGGEAADKLRVPHVDEKMPRPALVDLRERIGHKAAEGRQGVTHGTVHPDTASCARLIHGAPSAVSVDIGETVGQGRAGGDDVAGRIERTGDR